MSRNISLNAKKALFASEMSEVFLVLLTIDHISLANPIRVCNNVKNIASRGAEFIAFPFHLNLPSEDEDRPQRAKLVIDNIDRLIVKTIRELSTPPNVLIEIIRAEDPDVVEASFPDFSFTNIRYDANIVEGDLTIESFVSEPYPFGTFNPSYFPGIF